MLRPVLVLTLTLSLAAPAVASKTSHWTHTSEADFQKGTLRHVVATNLGDLKLSRSVQTLLEQDPEVSAVYALARTRDGTIYAGTGPQGVVLQIKDQNVSRLLRVEEANVFSLAIDAKGALLIGTGGDRGRILRMNKPGDEPVEIFSAEGVQYIWSMTTTPDGMIYAGTGPNGQVFAVGGDGTHEILLDTEENNILACISDGKDLLYIGTDPKGLVYRIHRKTRDVYVMLDAAETEISALALDGRGNLYAATAEAIGGATTPGPAVEQIGRPEGATGGVPIPAPQRPAPEPPPLPDPNPGEPHPIPKGLPLQLNVLPLLDDGETEVAAALAPAPSRPRQAPPPRPTMAPPAPAPGAPGQAREGGNAIYRIDAEGLVTEVFRQPVLVLSMIAHDEKLLIGTGSEGQIFQIDPRAEEVIALAKVEAKQVMALLPAEGRIVLGLANTGGISVMTQGYAGEGTFTSPVLDAQQISRFGKMRLRGSLPPRTTLKVSTRSGNVAEPTDLAWSKWSEPVSAQEFLAVQAPAARFLQYRLTFRTENPSETPVVEDVNVAYAVPNLAPRIKSIKVAVASKQQSSETPADARTRTITWEAEDPNGDSLVYRLEYRMGSRAPWILLKDEITETSFEWDTQQVADGRYEVRVTASDKRANAPGEGRASTRVSDPVQVDNTPPVISGLKASSGAGEVRVEFRATDRTSTLAAFAYTVNSGPHWQTVLPSDNIADSPDESVSFTIRGLEPGTHQIAVRATDALGNHAIQAVTVTVDAPARRQ